MIAWSIESSWRCPGTLGLQCVVAIGKLADEVNGTGDYRRLDHLLVYDVQPTEADDAIL